MSDWIEAREVRPPAAVRVSAIENPDLEFPEPGLYLHYRGDLYFLEGFARDSTNDANGRMMALYRSLKYDARRVRDLREFTELVSWPDGRMRPRFERVGTHPGDRMSENELKNFFTYHPPRTDQIGKYTRIRDAGLAFAQVLVSQTPAGPDQSDAVRKVREAVMTANAAIACGG